MQAKPQQGTKEELLALISEIKKNTGYLSSENENTGYVLEALANQLEDKISALTIPDSSGCSDTSDSDKN